MSGKRVSKVIFETDWLALCSEPKVTRGMRPSRLLKNGHERISASFPLFFQKLPGASRGALCRGVQAQNALFEILKTQFSPDLYRLN